MAKIPTLTTNSLPAMEKLKSHFSALVSKYSNDQVLAEKLWHEIASAYAQKDRHYHTLSHLQNLYNQLIEINHLIEDFNVVMFSLYYHDIVYSATAKDNEEKSAEMSIQRMRSIGVPENKIEKCSDQILATKSHLVSKDEDTNLFTDADLSILGMKWEDYETYFRQVRKEYSIYPDLLYKPGRRKVLKHFLEMERIFKTDHFYQKFELQARMNLEKELQILSA